MKWREVTGKRILGGISILLLVLFAAIGGWMAEDKRFAARQKAEEERRSAEREAGAEPSEADLYWELAQNMLSDMLLEQEVIKLGEIVREGHELFGDEWFFAGDRLTEPYLYLFPCKWYDESKTDPDGRQENDLTYMGVEKRRAGDFKGYFVFYVWVKKTDHGVELGTDFHQKMFEYILYECSKEHYEEKAYLAGVSPSENWMLWYPLYDLLGEPVAMVSVTQKEKLEPVFRDACERMYERQKQAAGELGQQVRFGAFFDSESLSWRNKDDPEYREFEKDYWKRRDWSSRKSTYDSYRLEKWDVEGYWRWLDRYGDYYPVYDLDFHTGYDAEKQNIFREMCVDREEQLELWRAKEAAKKEKERQKDAQQKGAEQEEGQQEAVEQNVSGEDAKRGVWTVEKGDTLWEIARRKYGDGSFWPRIYEKNRDVIGEDGRIIFPGQRLEMP